MNKLKVQKYPAYKNSGVEWLGEIPEHWELRRFKYLFKEINERSTQGSEDLLSVSQYTGVTKKSDKVEEGDLLTTASTLEGYKKVYKNDLVSNIMLAWNGSLGFSPFDGITSPAYSIYRLNNGHSERFFHYLVRSQIYKSEFKRNSSGVIESRLRLYTDDFFAIWSILPPIQEQTAIAKFLDDKTAKIDRAIAQKEQLISLLKERKQIIIQDLVTGKKVWNSAKNAWTAPDKVKDSGVEWIGEIPEGWEVIALNFAIDAVGDVDHYMPPTIDEGIPYLMTGDLKEFASNIDFEGCKKVSSRDYINLTKKIKTEKGDVILARYATIGTSTYVDIDSRFLVSYSCVTIKPKSSRLSGLFLFYYFKTNAFETDIKNQINTNTQGNVGIGDLKKVKLILPPIQEQTAIVAHIEVQSAKIDKAIALQKQQIKKLKELKATLIDGAVTGKLRVPSVQKIKVS